MKLGLIAMCIIFLPTAVFAQHSDTRLFLQSRTGYSTNSYLNPFFSEWDSSQESFYGLVMPMARWHRSGSKTDVQVSGGVAYQPTFGVGDQNFGSFGRAEGRYRFGSLVSAGLETGSGYLSTSYTRKQWWAQPSLTFHFSPFSRLKFKAGSHFQSYSNYADSLDITNRLDIFSVEMESWPTTRWQLKTGLYGNLDNIATSERTLNASLGIVRLVNDDISVALQLSHEQYNFATSSQSGDGGFTVMPDPDILSDRIFRFGTGVDIPVRENIAVTLNADALRYSSSAATENTYDFQASAGIKISLRPPSLKKNKTVKTSTKQDGESTRISVTYRGEGKLYLSGDFNDWQEPGEPLVRQSKNRYSASLKLAPGAYEYKVLRVYGNEEEWLDLHRDTYTVDDGFGGENGFLLIE